MYPYPTVRCCSQGRQGSHRPLAELNIHMEDASALEISDAEASDEEVGYFSGRELPAALSEPVSSLTAPEHLSAPQLFNVQEPVEPAWASPHLDVYRQEAGIHEGGRRTPLHSPPPTTEAQQSASNRPSVLQPGRRRIPGPAGALESDGCECAATSVTQGTLFPSQQLREKALSFFHKTPAWLELEAAFSVQRPGMTVPGRQTLHQVIQEASAPPPVPLRVAVVCALIKYIGAKESSGDDVLVTLADESGTEMDGTIHGTIFNEQPGLLMCGAALALKDVPVFSLAPFSHHLLIHPSSVVRVIPPKHAANGSNAKGAPTPRDPFFVTDGSAPPI